jgi:predicted NBD/HSP70 family sugar kinase
VARKDQRAGDHRPVRHRAPRTAVPLGHAQMRVANAWAVLHALRGLGTASRTQLAAATGLTGMTIHRVIEELRDRGLVVLAGMAADGGVGRPSSLFRLNAAAGTVLGIDVGNETVRIAVTDLGRTATRRIEVATAAVEADLAGGLVALVADLRSRGEPFAQLVGAAVGVPAIPGDDGRIVRASQHHGWEGLELGARLREAWGCPVVIRQDDHLAAFAELTIGACRGARTAVVINVGKGVGVGLVSDGAVHTGGRQAAGRIGWIPTSIRMGVDDGRDADGAPLGEALTADGLIADYRALGGTAPVASARDVFAADAVGDAAAAAGIDRFAARLAWAMATVIAVVDPEIVVFGGGISGSWRRLERPVVDGVRGILPGTPPIVASTLGQEAVVTGAVEAAMDLGDAWLHKRLESGSSASSPRPRRRPGRGAGARTAAAVQEGTPARASPDS